MTISCVVIPKKMVSKRDALLHIIYFLYFQEHYNFMSCIGDKFFTLDKNFKGFLQVIVLVTAEAKLKTVRVMKLKKGSKNLN